MKIDIKRISSRIFIALFCLVLIGLGVLTTVDSTGYKKAAFYRSTMDRRDSLVVELSKQIGNRTLSAGWGVANITPPEPVRLTGKNFKPYTQVFDSVFVRSILFSNGDQKLVLLSYDLWIMHPALAHYLRVQIAKEFPEITGILFTANHSHTSIGGWAPGLVGALVAGGYQPETVDFIGRQTLNSLRMAHQNLRPTTSGYDEVATTGLVRNRLDEKGNLDTKLRILKMKNNLDQVALFTTFSAHSVYMNKDINTLSADYPGPFLRLVEEVEGIDFASFSPGATGSHTPIGRKPFKPDKMLSYAQRLADYSSGLQAKIITDSTEQLKYMEWPIDLRSPHFRISNHLRVRPWLFSAVMGKHQARITAIRVGNTVIVGLPVELSGEFYPQFDAICEGRGLSLMITSFNGWYLGYVNPESYYYTLNRSETREMNWLGPQSGEYFVELITELLNII